MSIIYGKGGIDNASKVYGYEGVHSASRIYIPLAGGLVETATLAGTLSGSTEIDIVAGGKTTIINLTNDTWIAAGTGVIGTAVQTASIIAGMLSAQSEVLGWNNEVTGVLVRNSDSQATITWSASANYDITAQEVLTLTVPADVLITSSISLVATPTINIDFVDVTAPILSLPTGIKTGTTTADGTVTTDEGNGILYYIATTNVTELEATIRAGSNQVVSISGVQNVLFTSLTPGTIYYAHYVQDDAEANTSNITTSSSFTTDSVAITADIGGTLLGSFESNIVTGGKTIILTLTNDTWVTAGTGPIGSIANTQAIIDGITSAQTELLGWNNEVRDKEVTTAVVRTSNTVCTITLTAQIGYDITANETITATIPAVALVTSLIPVVATPTITVNFTTASTVTNAGGNVQDGEAFSIYYVTGGLTGSTTVTINGISCTSVVVVDDNNMTAVAPVDDLLHNTSYILQII